MFQSGLQYQTPNLLTAKHPVVQLLLERESRDNIQEGTEYVKNILQQKLKIVEFGNALQKIKSRCIECRLKRQPNPPTDGRPIPRTTR